MQLARKIADGTPITGVTWTANTRDERRARDRERAVTKEAALALLAENSTAAADAIRSFTDDDLDCAVTVSLYADAELTCQFILEDHTVRHSFHHLARLRAALQP